MVPCATKYEIERQFQVVYTISKLREVQYEFTGKVYCDLLSASKRCLGTMYEVREDVINDDHCKKKTSFISLARDESEVMCSYHLFEFQRIICKHAITVLICNDVESLSDKYNLRRWWRDMTRSHTRVAMNYDGLVSAPAQLMYDKMVKSFATLANLTIDDDVRSGAILEWIEAQYE